MFFICFAQFHTSSLRDLQSWPKYFRQTVALCEIASYGKSSISTFQEFFASIDKILIVGARLSAGL